MLLSVIIPVYNERQTLGLVLASISRVLPGVHKEIIIVDDYSDDGTREWIRANVPNGSKAATEIDIDADGNLTFSASSSDSAITLRSFYHDQNQGKGAAIQTGFAAMTGDVVVIQDADLEYDPHDWVPMYDLIAVRRVADVVYGSRFYGRPHRSLYFHHYLANRLLTLIFNILYNQTFTDIETCYKMMTRQALKKTRLSANDFGIEIELSANLARQRCLRIYELGISYYGRTYAEGKKINWKDGAKALWYLVKFRFG
jgi:glycosyltransferase involved in cell wall biosynthesis